MTEITVGDSEREVTTEPAAPPQNASAPDTVDQLLEGRNGPPCPDE